MECWASELGGCGGGTSREHYVSDAIFDGEAVRVFGFSWCQDEPKTIGVGAATSKILCRNHNSALSDCDAEASKLSLFLKRGVVDTPEESQTIQLSGFLLERWFLKTLLNFGFLGALDSPAHTKISPPLDVVKRIFEDERPANGSGLYFVAGPIKSSTFENGVSWHSIKNVSEANKPIVGMAITFNGVRFVTTVLPVRAEEIIARMGVRHGIDYSTAKILFRPNTIVLKSSTAGRKVIELAW